MKGILLMAHYNTFKRKEIKYLLSRTQYAELMQEVAQYIRPDFYAESVISNIYCDSDNFELARRSIDGPVYKEKLRLRCYGEISLQNNVFLELKKKYKGVVYKRRFECGEKEAMVYLQSNIKPLNANQMFNEIDFAVKHYSLKPKVFLAYDRKSFCGTDDEEFRITFDTAIRYRTEMLDFSHSSNGLRLLPLGSVIMEIKAVQAMPVWMLNVLRSMQLTPSSFSKYGCAYKDIIKKQGGALCLKVS